MNAVDQVMNKTNRLMDQNRSSNPRRYEAIVMKNYKPTDGNRIRFIIPELIPMTEGIMMDNPIPLKRQYKDPNGYTVTARATHNNQMEAIYYSHDSLRKTPPNVQLNERVIVWQVADTDVWYWEPINLDSQTRRRTETVVHSINADNVAGGDPKIHDASNTYYMEMSSQNKTVTLSTSAKNGEVSGYKIQINGKEGAIVLKDGDEHGNYVQIDTVGVSIILHNGCDTEVNLHENHISIKCNETRTTKIGTDDSLEVGGNQTIHVKGDVNLTVDGNLVAKVSGNTELTCPTITMKGNVTIEGDLGVTGGTTLGGGGTVEGDLGVSGDTSIGGSLDAAGKVSFPVGGTSGRISGSGD